MAHFALTNTTANDYRAFERFSRGAANLAGAQSSPYNVWLENWRVEEVEPNVYRLIAAQDDITLELLLTDDKGPVLQGINGYSQKGPEPGNASYYYSLTRLLSSGTVRIGGRNHTVEGLSWMDHEYSTSVLSSGQIGWDWFSIQLDDHSELMVYQFRRNDGSIDPFSSGTFIAPDGTTTHLSREDFEITVGDTWRSPHSGATYPAQWTVNIPSVDLILEIVPHMADQELNVSFIYWEGAVRVSGEHQGQTVNGNGYVEMTGYAASMEDQF